MEEDAARRDAIDQALELLARLRGHRLWTAIEGATECYHELEFTNQKGGRSDLLYRDGDGWHILDFKSDPIESKAHREALIEDYLGQLRGYQRALRWLLGVAADAAICFLDDRGEVKVVRV